jgi:hypothetical protein
MVTHIHRSIGAVLVVLLLPIGATWAQAAATEPLCAKYVGVAVGRERGEPVKLTCDDIRRHFGLISLRETSLGYLVGVTRRLAPIHYEQWQDRGALKGLSCAEESSGGRKTLSCRPQAGGTEFTLNLELDERGHLATLTAEDSSYAKRIQGIAERAGKENGWDTVYPEFGSFMLDVLVARNNSIAAANETYSRTMRGIQVQIAPPSESKR